MRLQVRSHLFGYLLLSLPMGLGLLAGCGKKKSADATDGGTTSQEEGGDTSTIALAGQIALTGTGSTETLGLTGGDTVDIASLSVYCVSFSLPPVAGAGTVDAEGNFLVPIAAKDVSVGCFILQGEDVKGSIVFQDSTKKDLSGKDQTQDRLAFAGGKSDLGKIIFDLDKGQAVVDISKIVMAGSAAAAVPEGDAYDFTGSYLMTSAGIDLPTGYSGACPAGSEDKKNSGDSKDECRGPEEGMKIWINRIAGKAPDTGNPAFVFQLWESKDLYEKCGSKLGVSYADAIAHGFDFSASGVAEGDLTWDPAYVDGWKKTGATANNSYMTMETVDNFKGMPGTKQFFEQYHSWKCEPGKPCQDGSQATETPGFMFNADTKETGCKDPTGKPVQPESWSGQVCTNEDLTGDSVGLMKSTCTMTQKGVVLTCVNIGGMFDMAGKAIKNAQAKYPDDFKPLATGATCSKGSQTQRNNNTLSCPSGETLVPGTACANIEVATDAGKLAQLRCYMEAGGDNHDSADTCQRQVRANWNAKKPAEFLANHDGPSIAKGEYLFEPFTYDSATSGTLRSEEHEFRGLRVGNNWTDCEVVSSMSFSFKKYDDSSDLLTELIETTRNISPKPACIAEYGEAQTSKSLVKMIKQ